MYKYKNRISITEDDVTVIQIEKGQPFTLYHEDAENVTFCSIQPPYKSTMLRRNIQGVTMISDVDNTQVTRYKL